MSCTCAARIPGMPTTRPTTAARRYDRHVQPHAVTNAAIDGDRPKPRSRIDAYDPGAQREQLDLPVELEQPFEAVGLLRQGALRLNSQFQARDRLLQRDVLLPQAAQRDVTLPQIAPGGDGRAHHALGLGQKTEGDDVQQARAGNGPDLRRDQAQVGDQNAQHEVARAVSSLHGAPAANRATSG